MPAQRRYFRVPARLEARLVLRGESSVSASLSDLSLDGSSMVVRATDAAGAVAARRWLSRGALVHVEVTLGRHPIVLPGRVVWMRPVDGSREILVGTHFEELDKATTRILRHWLLTGLSAIQGAARHVLSDRWNDAAECLEAVGIDDAVPNTISAVLRYAAAGRALTN